MDAIGIAAASAGTPEENTAPSIRWGLAGLGTGLGVLILGLGWHFGIDENPFGLLLNPFGWAINAPHASLMSNLLLNIGVTVMLAVVLILFERIILTSVKRATDESEQRAELKAEAKAEEIVNERVVSIEARIDGLDTRVNEYAKERAQKRNDAARNIFADHDFGSVAEKLTRIASVGAVARPDHRRTDGAAEFIVPAGTELSSPRVLISFTGDDHPRTPYVSFTILLADKSVSATWSSHVQLEEALQTLQEELVKEGEAAVWKHVSPEALLHNISEFLVAAAAGRNADDGAWLSGEPAREMVAEGWIITDAGLEVRGHGLLVPRTDLGARDPRNNMISAARVDPSAPDGLDQETYTVAVTRAKQSLLRPNDTAPRLGK